MLIRIHLDLVPEFDVERNCSTLETFESFRRRRTKETLDEGESQLSLPTRGCTHGGGGYIVMVIGWLGSICSQNNVLELRFSRIVEAQMQNDGDWAV